MPPASPVEAIGRTKGSRLIFELPDGDYAVALAELRRAHEGFFPALMGDSLVGSSPGLGPSRREKTHGPHHRSAPSSSPPSSPARSTSSPRSASPAMAAASRRTCCATSPRARSRGGRMGRGRRRARPRRPFRDHGGDGRGLRPRAPRGARRCARSRCPGASLYGLATYVGDEPDRRPAALRPAAAAAHPRRSSPSSSATSSWSASRSR